MVVYPFAVALMLGLGLVLWDIVRYSAGYECQAGLLRRRRRR